MASSARTLLSSFLRHFPEMGPTSRLHDDAVAYGENALIWQL